MFDSIAEVAHLNNCQICIAFTLWKCRVARDEDSKERLGGREGSLSVDHPDHAKSLVKRGRHSKQSN
jgi:hypothetical protein